MSIGVIRGAITIEKNCEEDILQNTTILLQEIINRNNIKNEDSVIRNYIRSILYLI